MDKIQGRQYCSPSKKYVSQVPMYVSNLSHKQKKISAQQAAIPLPKPVPELTDLLAAFRKLMEERKHEDMDLDRIHDRLLYDDCGGVGNGDEMDIDDGYSSDHELGSNEEEK